MILIVVTLDVEGVAKLASAFQLLLFALLNLAVIVMRESRIEAYDPGYTSPLYPWMQFTGFLASLWLIALMGWMPLVFTIGMITVSGAWYRYYARDRVVRDGAIYHVFERLGRRRFAGLEHELRDIMKEKGLRAEDPFDEVVARAIVITFSERVPLSRIIREAAARLHSRVPVDGEQLVEAFMRGAVAGGTPVSHGAALLHTRLPAFEGSELLLVRCGAGVELDVADETMARQAAETPIGAIFFLVSGVMDPGRHLRILAQLAGRVEDPAFMPEWLADRDEQELKEILLRDDRFLRLRVGSGPKTAALAGRALRDLQMPEGTLVAIIQRNGQPLVPRGRTVLRQGDRLTIIGEPGGLREVERRYGD
jgi:mannitol/fructose-specific phosphotransferase system IIA component (Ntr-type)